MVMTFWRLNFLSINVNSGCVGIAVPEIFGMGRSLRSLARHEELWLSYKYRYIKSVHIITGIWDDNTIKKWRLFRNRPICIYLNKNSENNALNTFLCATVCWIYTTTTPPVFTPAPTTPPAFKPVPTTPLFFKTSRPTNNTSCFKASAYIRMIGPYPSSRLILSLTLDLCVQCIP